jgi:hypothetical protein
MKALVGLLLVLSVCLAGCPVIVGGALIATGAAGAAWYQGELEWHHGGTYDRTWEATQAALKKFDIRVTKAEKGPLDGMIEGRKRDDTSVLVNIKARREGVTTVGIRIGLMGDRGQSDLIQRQIEANLKGGAS